jgi:hypothetical protein
VNLFSNPPLQQKSALALALDLRFKEKNIHLDPLTSKYDKYKTCTWSVKNYPALEYEEGTVSYDARYPGIILASNHFKFMMKREI